MKPFEIKHKVTGKVIFKLECKSLRLCLIAAVDAKADLRGADLGGADLGGADLGGAYGEKIKIKKTPLQILGLHWDIIIFDSHMKIGCESHLISEWEKFADDKISEMESNALEFWNGSKSFLLSFCRANGRG